MILKRLVISEELYVGLCAAIMKSILKENKVFGFEFVAFIDLTKIIMRRHHGIIVDTRGTSNLVKRCGAEGGLRILEPREIALFLSYGIGKRLTKEMDEYMANPKNKRDDMADQIHILCNTVCKGMIEDGFFDGRAFEWWREHTGRSHLYHENLRESFEEIIFGEDESLDIFSGLMITPHAGKAVKNLRLVGEKKLRMFIYNHEAINPKHNGLESYHIMKRILQGSA